MPQPDVGAYEYTPIPYRFQLSTMSFLFLLIAAYGSEEETGSPARQTGVRVIRPSRLIRTNPPADTPGAEPTEPVNAEDTGDQDALALILGKASAIEELIKTAKQ